MKKEPTRQRFEPPTSITLTKEQLEWIDGQRELGQTRSEALRHIINDAMTRATKNRRTA